MYNTYFYKNYENLKNRIFLVFNYILINFIINYFYCDECIYFLIKPLLIINNIEYLIVTEVTEIFLLQLFVSSIFSIFFSLWYIVIQLSIFFFDGGYKIENLKIIGSFFFFLLSFMTNHYIILNIIIPSIFNFFILIEKTITINESLQQIFFEPKLSNYISLVIKSIVFSHLFLQYPIILLYLLLLNIIRIDIINNYRKIIYLKIWILSTFVTPPDILTSLILSFILCLFLEIIIYITIYWKNFKNIFNN